MGCSSGALVDLGDYEPSGVSIASNTLTNACVMSITNTSALINKRKSNTTLATT